MKYLFTNNGLRILMYHKVSEVSPDASNVTVQQFDQQLNYLKNKSFTVLSLAEVLAENYIPKNINKTVVITFDDGYSHCYDYAYPILKSYNFAATIFLPTAFIGDKSRWDKEKADDIMDVNVLKSMDHTLISYGLHTHEHFSYEDRNLETIRKDLFQNLAFFKDNNLQYLPALAYPFGKRPKRQQEKTALFSIFDELGIKYAFRIGNRVNKWPLRHPYEIERIDVRGQDSMQKFIWKLHVGKLF